MQVNRPMSMKKDGIQTRKRKPKTSSGSGKSSKSSSPNKEHSIHVEHQKLVQQHTSQPSTHAHQYHSHLSPPSHQPSNQGLLDLSFSRNDNSGMQFYL